MPLTVAITGLHRGENPQPGCGIIRALRRARKDLRIAGLVYGPYESGAYDSSLVDSVYTIPYVAAGTDVFFQRLDEIGEAEGIDIFFPTLDAEIEPLVASADGWAERSVVPVLPDERAFKARAKANLSGLCKRAGCPCPVTRVIEDLSPLGRETGRLERPVYVKGRHYGARLVGDPASLFREACRTAADWGWPILLQERITGEEINVAGVGDGKGNCSELVSLRKCLVSADGKGYGGVTIVNRELDGLSRSLIEDLRWRGPFELEFVRAPSGELFLIEMNPRFPAWIELAAALGCNLPAAALALFLGEAFPDLRPCPAGKFFIRHSVDLCGEVGDLGELSTTGKLSWGPPDRLGTAGRHQNLTNAETS